MADQQQTCIAGSSSERRRVVWDESNLEGNQAYFDANPVTRHIDEPKTPYEPERAMDEEGNFVDSDDEADKLAKNPKQHYDEHGNPLLPAGGGGNAAAAASGGGVEGEEGVGGWDDETKSFARRARMAAPVVGGAGASPSSPFYANNPQYDTASSPDQSGFKKRRLQLGGEGGGGLTLGAPPSAAEAKAREEAQHQAEFQHMRKAVYADEGANFKEQLRLARLQAEADEAAEEEDDEAGVA